MSIVSQDPAENTPILYGRARTLDTNVNYVSAFDENKLLRWALQAEARALLPKERISKCYRVLVGQMVDLLYNPDHLSGSYGGLATCSSVWGCSVCASKISERRRVEIEQAIKAFDEAGCVILFNTYTVKHTRSDSLGGLLTPFLAAHRALKQGRRAVAFKEKYGLLGTIRALEVTWGKGSGWHPHVHEIMVLGNSEAAPEAAASDIWENWQAVTKRHGLKVNRKAFDSGRTRGAAADYFAKYGREPIKQPWGPEQELVKAHQKQARDAARFTPFGLLRGLLEGHTELGPVFVEFYQWFRGKRQLQWSDGLKALAGLKDKTDEELAQEAQEHDALLGRLSREDWHVVLGNDLRGELLQIVAGSLGQWEPVADWLRALGCAADHVVVDDGPTEEEQAVIKMLAASKRRITKR